MGRVRRVHEECDFIGGELVQQGLMAHDERRLRHRVQLARDRRRLAVFHAEAVRQRDQDEVDGLVADQAVVTDLYARRVKKHHRVDRFQRAVLPGGHLRPHAVGDRADEVRADLGAVAFQQKALDLPRRQTAPVQRDQP